MIKIKLSHSALEVRKFEESNANKICSTYSFQIKKRKQTKVLRRERIAYTSVLLSAMAKAIPELAIVHGSKRAGASDYTTNYFDSNFMNVEITSTNAVAIANPFLHS